MSSQRVAGLDFLRGWFILMAIFEHYTGYLNYWYIDFFGREQARFGSLYASHLPMVGQLNPMDGFTATLSSYLVPWVSQIYLMLAAFNLASRSQERARAELPQKLGLFAALYLVFALEGLLIAPNLGEALSFYPQMLWMVLLALFCVVYAYAGIRGMLALTGLALVWPLLSGDNPFAAFEAWMKANVHPAYEFDARVDLFGASGALGFVYGWLWAQRPQARSRLNHTVLALSALCLAAYALWGQAPAMNLQDIYATEHDLAEDAWGLLGILGMEFGVVALVLALHQRGIELCWRPINWIGFYSLTVFIFHKALFVHLWGPALTWVTAKLDTTLPNSFPITLALTLTAVGVAWAIKRSGIVDRITGRSQDGQWQRHYGAVRA